MPEILQFFIAFAIGIGVIFIFRKQLKPKRDAMIAKIKQLFKKN